MNKITGNSIRVLTLIPLMVAGLATFIFLKGKVDDQVYAMDSAVIPPGLVKGATFFMNNGVMGRVDHMEVIGTQGSWVHVKVIEAQLWKPSSEVWINLGTTQQMSIEVVQAKPIN